jgi:hypothetical protein
LNGHGLDASLLAGAPGYLFRLNSELFWMFPAARRRGQVASLIWPHLLRTQH